MSRYLLALLLAMLQPAVNATAVSDDLQRKVHLDAAAMRIVTLSPHATELVIAAGAQDRLVGAPAVAGRQLHDRVIAIGGPGPLDRERLLALQPELVVAWQTGNRAADLTWIARNGIALFVSEPDRLSDIANAIRAIGRLSATEAEADRHARAFEIAVQSSCVDLPPLPVYVEIWDQPPMTVGGRHWLNEVLRAAGYRNVYADQPRGVFAVSPEANLVHHAVRRVSLLPDQTGLAQRRLADFLSRPGPMLADAVQYLCAQRGTQRNR